MDRYYVAFWCRLFKVIQRKVIFHASWKVAENALIAFYSKVWKDGKCRIRGERQEYPCKPLEEALDEKLNLIGGVNGIVH
ncbi:MAG: hypothetical protein WBF33_23865, partial [Candidatus Nitrosopolaris sp.]